MEFQNPRQASDLITTGCGTVVVAGKRRGDGVSCGTSHGSRVGRKDAVVISKLESTVTEEQRAFRGLRVSWDSFMRVRRTSHAPLAFAGVGGREGKGEGGTVIWKQDHQRALLAPARGLWRGIKSPTVGLRHKDSNRFEKREERMEG
ncbi:hypothetical protein C0Q70_05690 [Pomacea canaliculata]|uniref:Uncharacterized protein n=1 Tax=Pomacea canaliculata TaxID=400727 RepID=A0A2T7PM04_POMCA|nr:hypothetical protein C0Q70_05690 [Pomacea canaliculata]